ncbi:MAG: hypothetical protein SPK09_02670 [Porphyromonas sp.]|nr:hypothetical protein [Porphyromonas sp.]
MKISNTKQLRMNIQLWIATILTLTGIILLFAGFWVKPLGEIHNSVLIAFGEMSTFAGALFGVDYSYRFSSPRKKRREESSEPNNNAE